MANNLGKGGGGQRGQRSSDLVMSAGKGALRHNALDTPMHACTLEPMVWSRHGSGDKVRGWLSTVTLGTWQHDGQRRARKKNQAGLAVRPGWSSTWLSAIWSKKGGLRLVRVRASVIRRRLKGRGRRTQLAGAAPPPSRWPGGEARPRPLGAPPPPAPPGLGRPALARGGA